MFLPMRLISVMTPCFNEEGNVREMYEAVKALFAGLPQYRYEHIFIDNGSKDRTPVILRETRGAGHEREGHPQHAELRPRAVRVLRAAAGARRRGHRARVRLPGTSPELIPEFLRRWEAGSKVVVGVKESADESGLFYAMRDRYYRTLARIADIELVRQSTGFGCYDQSVIESLRRIDDPYPYFRGLIAEIGHEPSLVPFHQPLRQRGISSQNFYTLYDMAFLGIVNHSKVPLRMATMSGFALAIVSLLTAIGYLAAKLLFWNRFSLGIAPILIGFFFLTAVQLFFIGIVGEYIGAIYTQVRHHPHVFEKDRINF